MIWVHDANGWTSNGFLIRHVGPSRWTLTNKQEAAVGPVQVLAEPLAVETTLSAAKREAEVLARAERRAEERRRWWALAAAAVAGAALASSLVEPWNAFAAFGLALVALRCLVNVLWSRLERFTGSSDDFFYQ